MTKCDDKNINTLNRSTSDCIYLKTCGRCDLQHVGETVQFLNDRFSDHRTGMKNARRRSGIFIVNFEHISHLVLVFLFVKFVQVNGGWISKHFGIGHCRNSNYIINIIEKLSGSGRDDNDIPIPGVTVEKQKKETKWMLTLQTVYPYGLNDRVGDEYMVEKESRVVVISSYHYIVYVNAQIIITLKQNLIILS